MELRFTKFPEQTYPNNSTPAEITKHCLDQSYTLELMIKSHKRYIIEYHSYNKRLNNSKHINTLSNNQI